MINCFTTVLASVTLLTALVFPLDRVLGEPQECTLEFQKEEEHTMCLPDDSRVYDQGVSGADRTLIVDLHNDFRAKVTPPATDLAKLSWDDRLAAVAAKWAKQCVLGHDKKRDVPSYGQLPIGQNVAAGYRSWRDAVMGWYNEVKDYKYGKDPDSYLGPGGFAKIGHYTQIVTNTTFRLGCGFAKCHASDYGYYYVCNYGKGQSNAEYPYTTGMRSAKCPHSASNGICDCGGKWCLNGGALDIDLCTCSCTALYSGDMCEKLECPETDNKDCWDVYPKDYCLYSNIKEMCPYMCDICGGSAPSVPTGACSGKYCHNGGKLDETTCKCSCPSPYSGERCEIVPEPTTTVSVHNCTFVGVRPTPEVCSLYGESGADKPICATRSGHYDCDDCDKYIDMKTKHCPVMCGLCDGPCGGKNCQNGGTLDRTTCQCTCDNPFKGEHCEEVSCPEPDPVFCRTKYQPSDCSVYTNMKNMCPWMCGVCQAAGETGPLEYISSHGCKHLGSRPSKEQCKKYDVDTIHCETNGGSYGCSACTQYSNLKTEYCPIMCGYCDPPCDGKLCLNGGRLDSETCDCSCAPHFSGAECDTLTCPENDKWHCQFFERSACYKYSNLPEDCPHKCGLCSGN